MQIEEKDKRLEEIVAAISKEGVSLDDALKLHAEGVAVADEIITYLDSLKRNVEAPSA